VVILHTRSQSILGDLSEKEFFRVVKAGFSAKRKKLRSSLAGGLGVAKDQAMSYLELAGIDADQRAEDLSINDWMNLTKVIIK